MTSNKKVIISLSIIGLLLVSLAISYAYFSAKITNNESESTVVGTAAYLELTFIDGSPEINGSNIIPGWSASKTFKVQNTGEKIAYYKLRILNISNPFVDGGLSYQITSNNGGENISKRLVLASTRDISLPIEIGVGEEHNYTITTYYNNLDIDQSSDLGESFSYTIGIESVKELIGNPLYWDNPGENTLLGAIKQNYPKAEAPETIPAEQYSLTASNNGTTHIINVPSDYIDYYYTYGTGVVRNANGKFNLTGVNTCKFSDESCRKTLIGKYIVSSAWYSYSDFSNITDTPKTTTNLMHITKISNISYDSAGNSKIYCDVSNSLFYDEMAISATPDDYGTSYYFRGNPNNNYVVFANKCWRIVRVDGNGNIKLWLWNNENSCLNNAVEQSVFNTSDKHNAYIGFMYGNIESNEFSNASQTGVHDNIHDSTILTNLKSWYDNTFNTANTSNYTNLLADTIWCGDKKLVSGNGINNVSRYGFDGRTTNPSLICQDAVINDINNLSRYTAYAKTDNNNTKGNGKLNGYKIGLITADELLFAGIVAGHSNSDDRFSYVTMVPKWYYTMSMVGTDSGGKAFAFIMMSNGHLTSHNGYLITGKADMRPAVSLIPSVTLTSTPNQDGTKEHPYEIEV